MNHRNLIASALTFACAPGALAGIFHELVPAWRGDANATYSGWNSFTSAYAGPNSPDQPGSSVATLFNFAPGSQIVAGGALFSATSPLSVLINGGVLDAPNVPLEVILNIGTIGTYLDDSSVTFSAITSTGIVDFSPTSSEIRYDVPVAPGNGVQTRAYRWDLSALPVQAIGYQIYFRSAASQVSLTGVAVDIRYVPAPAAGVILLAGLTRSRRRR